MKSIRIRKRGKTFSYIFEAGRIDGKRKVVEKGGYTTKEEAYDAGVQAYTSWKHGNIGITSERIIVADFLDKWLQTIKANIRASTYHSYYTAVNLHIKPMLGNIVLQELSPRHVDEWIRQQSTIAARRTTQTRRTILSVALNYAIYPCELISYNPVARTKLPKIFAGNTVERKIISPEQFNSLLDEYPFPDTKRLMLMILFYTGVRSGELFGLTWDNINFQAHTITIEKQTIFNNRKRFIGETKNESSKRTIPINDILYNELVKYKEVYDDCDVRRVYYVHKKTNRIVATSDNYPVTSDYYRIDFVCTHKRKLLSNKALIKMLRAHNLNAHSFRHTHATHLIEAGAPIKAVTHRLGHASTAITEDLYVRATEELSRQAIEILDKKYADKD